MTQDTMPATVADSRDGLRPGGLLLRVLPTGLYAGRARMLVERSLLVNRRTWLAVVSGFCEPLIFLAAMGIGFGSLTGQLTGPDGEPVSYVAFVAPALLAASAMNGAAYDATFNIFFKLKYNRTYEAMLTTPLGPIDIALGEIAWALLRGGLYALGFFGVMLGLGLVTSPWALLVVPAALLVAFGFAAVGMAATTFMRSWHDFDLVQLALLPMFLFSTTFFPLSVYPVGVQVGGPVFPAVPRDRDHARAVRRGGRRVDSRPPGVFRGDGADRGGGRGPPAGAPAAEVRRRIAKSISADDS